MDSHKFPHLPRSSICSLDERPTRQGRIHFCDTSDAIAPN
ncbi:hypothetical protein Y88_1098 [Novosphingobium nitrogenifigens DSM 19370]|uniref:Uncharacterized protein n=1 Tax=Novosphingobium nitrogenifigens DSM 19370 TaxID=983920 RepID=F1Z8I9_9SPHN|nr:hypothetical protein Y88_1098 [Novosphingobium nitrogenifigens DSM 19370]